MSAPPPTTLLPDEGPEHPTSSAPRTGLFASAPVLRYELGAGSARLADDVTGEAWQVAVFPEGEGATSVWLEAGGVRLVDQHGHDGSAPVTCLVRDQWNLLTVDLSAVPSHASIDLVVLDGARGRGWVQMLGPTHLPRFEPDVVEYVRTARGSHSRHAQSRGNTYPLACVPHGFTFVSPVSDARADDWIFTWHPAGGPRLEALSFCHAPSPWIRDRAAIQLMSWQGTPSLDPAERAIGYDPRDMVDRPHLFWLRLADGSTAEVTPTDHGAVFRFTWHEAANRDSPRGALVDLARAGEAWFEQLPDGRVVISGVARPTQVWGRRLLDPTCYFWGVTRQPCRIRPGRRSTRWPWPGRGTKGGILELVTGEVLEVAMATSFISVDQARHNLDLEIGPDDYETVATRAHDQWEELLGRFTLTGANHDQLVSAYSNLARLHCWPNSMHENLGSADQPRWAHTSPFIATGHGLARRRTSSPVVDGQIMINNGYWDTYRGCWPAYNLFTPDLAPQLTEGLLAAWRESGWMGRWSAPGHVDCMVGTSSDVIFADAARHGVAFDELAGYDSALRNACCPSPDPMVGRKGIASGRFRGHVTTSTREGFSWSIENAICDAAIAGWSARLADRADELGVPGRADEFRAHAVWFSNRALAARELFDPAVGFFQGRRPDGRPTREPGDFDPARWGGDFTETNAWGMSVSTVHDGEGLAALYGGPSGLGDHLDRLFATPELGANPGGYPTAMHEIVEARALRMGQWALSNQPAHHIPFMYAFTDRPWRCQEITRAALDRAFVGSEIGQGYPGDEDNGEMSSWWLFAALGLYPLFPSSGEYVLTTPLFGMRVERPEGALEVRTHGEGRFIQRVQLDGQEWTAITVPVERLRGAVTIDVWRGDEPSTFGLGSSPFSLPATSHWRADLSGSATITLRGRPATALANDHGDVAVDLGDDDELMLRWCEAVELRALTLTFASPGTRQPSVRVGAGRAGEGREWQLGRRQAQWPNQTLCWLLADGEPITASELRIRPGSGLLAQVECW